MGGVRQDAKGRELHPPTGEQLRCTETVGGVSLIVAPQMMLMITSVFNITYAVDFDNFSAEISNIFHTPIYFAFM